MSIHVCAHCGKEFEYAGNVKYCNHCRHHCFECGEPVKRRENLCGKCKYKRDGIKRVFVKCKAPGCQNLIREDKGRSGYCWECFDFSTRNVPKRGAYRTFRIKDVGLKAWDTPYIITVCDICDSVYLATPGAIHHGGANCCSPECAGVNAAKNTPKKDTSIELAIERALIDRGLNYQKQVPMLGITIVDFYLPDFGVVIYCDGDFWHSDKASKKRDGKQNAVLSVNGYSVYRFSGTEIRESAHDCLDKIKVGSPPVLSTHR